MVSLMLLIQVTECGWKANWQCTWKL